ncbi:discoidin domain-containing protein [Paenibacillus sp. CC-CFT747]|nr:discoidin domain-containing protein [Paenibacillus sp. CC-CFT747]
MRKWNAWLLIMVLISGVICGSDYKLSAEASSVNIAGLAQLQVDSVTGSNTAAMAVDGNRTTRWVSGGGTYEHEFIMTWDKAKSINQVKVWSGNTGTGASNWHIREYTLDYWDGSAWVTIAAVVDNDKDNNQGQFNDLVFAPVTVSKLRLHITKPSWGGYYSADDKIARLAEIEVYSIPLADLTAPQEVTNPVVTPADGQLTVTWTDPPDEDLESIRITRTGAVTESVYVPATVQTRLFSGLTNGTAYEFRLQAMDHSGNVSSGVVVSGTPDASVVPPSAGMDHFITRSGDKLMNGSKEFRFVSVNASNLTYLPAPVWHRADPWEQEDVFKSLRQMGGTATRIYTFTVKGGTANGDRKSHINGLRDYDEDFFRDLDKVLQLANQYEIRVIIPFLDTWDHVGGIKQFAALRGKTQDVFYTDQELKDDYKHLVHYVVNRTNTYTGVKYKDDKAILAWETGNELYSPDVWTQEMAAYLKSLDPNHLVMDGHYGITDASLVDPNVDIVSNHYYESGGPITLFVPRRTEPRAETKRRLL